MHRQRSLLLVVGVLLVAIVVARQVQPPASPSQTDGPIMAGPGLVLEVLDGDTARIRLAGYEGSVRIVGIDTPEIAHGDPAECYAEDAMAYTSATLLNHLVWLSFDAECQDFYDRDLAYVSNGEGEGGFFNRALARNGYATALAIDPNTTYSSVIDDDVAAARQGGLGLWSACADRAR